MRLIIGEFTNDFLSNDRRFVVADFTDLIQQKTKCESQSNRVKLPCFSVFLEHLLSTNDRLGRCHTSRQIEIRDFFFRFQRNFTRNMNLIFRVFGVSSYEYFTFSRSVFVDGRAGVGIEWRLP